MKCVKCDKNQLALGVLETGLTCQQCSSCGGSWVEMDDYIHWHKLNATRANFSLKQPDEITVEDSSAVLICPQCNQIMGKFKVGSEVDYRIDQCANCGGFWLDNGEWVNLIKLNLHVKINTIFTDSWQRRVREESNKRNAEMRYVSKFGEDTYKQAKRLRDTLAGNPFKSRVIAYLTNPEPKVPKQALPLNQSYCPKCSKLMARYKLADNSDIYIEQCDACGGIWADQDQWKNIRRKNFDLDNVFVEQKQRDLQHKIPYEDQYFEATFGKSLFQQVSAFKRVIEKHESKLELISYLSKETD